MGRDSDIEVPSFDVEEVSEEDYDSYDPHFTGNCICAHETFDHGYGGCNVDDCNCEAVWE